MLSIFKASVMVAAAATIGFAAEAEAKSRVVIGTTAYFTPNPYAESTASGYVNGCQTYGCLGYYDFKQGALVPMLAESWESVDPTTWVFKLRKDVKWQNGDPVTSADVIHSHWRQMNDPETTQVANGKDIESIEAVDDYTLKVKTKQPVAAFLFLFFDRLTITNKKLYDEYGAKVADKEHPVGFGPYSIASLSTGQRLVMEKVQDSVFAMPNSPDELIFQVMKEPEQRITALLNDEIQIALYVPPHMVDRVNASSAAKIALGNNVEVNMLVMNPTIKPWENKLLRQAVAYAIDKDSIIETVLGGLADKLDGPVGPGQYAYDPSLQPKYSFDPEKARQLVKEAGYPDGVDVEFTTTTNRYTNDKATSQAIVQMLKDVGINVTLKTPEWAKMSEDVEAGKVPMYYFGRGSVIDPSPMLSQYFETGVTKRSMYSNAQLDALLKKERTIFDPQERVKALGEAMSLVNEEAPAVFLWRMKLISGISNKIGYVPAGSAGVRGNDIVVKN